MFKFIVNLVKKVVKICVDNKDVVKKVVEKGKELIKKR